MDDDDEVGGDDMSHALNRLTNAMEPQHLLQTTVTGKLPKNALMTLSRRFMFLNCNAVESYPLIFVVSEHKNWMVFFVLTPA